MDAWIQADPNPVSRKRLDALARSDRRESLERLFPAKERLEFGTAGLRAAFGPGPLRMNDVTVMQTTAGLLKQLQEEFGADEVSARGIVIGYDHRASPEWGLSSKRFALAAASVLITQGVSMVYLMDELCPTPFVPFAIQQHGCVAGFMMTASHNPKDDAGFKVYWANACQIVSPLDDNVAKKILQSLELDQNAVKLLNSSEAEVFARCAPSKGLFENTADAYVRECTVKLCRFRSENQERLGGRNICYTAMHGVGHRTFTRLFKSFGFSDFVNVPEQAEPDYNFPTVPFPNPEERGALNIATSYANKHNCDLVLANDPDADRLAVAERGTDGTWSIFTGDEIAMLLAWWELEIFKHRHPIVTSTSKPAMVVSAVSSGFLKAMGDQRGCEVHETLTGFKWIGTKAKELTDVHGFKVLLSYEEAIGFCVGDVICDKDGISAGCVFAELYAHLVSTSTSAAPLSAKLEELRRTYGYHFTANGYTKTESHKAIFERIRNKGRYALVLGTSGVQFKVTRVRDLAKGIYLDSEDGIPKLPQASSMITFWMEPIPQTSGAQYVTRVTLRASGTEPKLKYYVETRGPDKDLTRQISELVVQHAVLGDLLSTSKL